MASSLDGKLLVAAIDFGTAYSGYAYALRTTLRNDPLNIEINSWVGEGVEMQSFKAPSSILLNPDKTFHSFGYEAEETYAELTEEETHKDWYFISKFKMKLLFEEKIERDREVETEDDKKVSGFYVLSMALNFMRDHLMTSLERKGKGVRMKDILWVITVPAIWSEAAKQFTREAAEKVGFNAESLMFAYEPEAAAIYCRLIPILSADDIKSGKASFSKGKSIMVVDVGGGTADFSVVEVIDEKTVNVVEKATGGPWGGVAMDELFKTFLAKFWGENVIEALRSKCFSDYLVLLRAFENKKRLINSKEKKPLCLTLTRSFKKTYEKETKLKFSNIEMKKEFNNHVDLEKYDMIINSDFIEDTMMKPVINKIVETTKNIRKNQLKRTVESIILVGGLSQCQPLVEEMKKQLPIPVYVPTDAGLAVLKGAILYGHDQNAIKARVCRYTYGVRTMRKYGNAHDESKLVVQEGKSWAKDCFKIFYKANEQIKLGDIRAHELEDTFKDEDRRPKRNHPIICDLFVSSESEPKYVTDANCHLLGHIYIDPPATGFPEHWEGTVEMEFGGTEIIGRVKDKFDTTTVRFDFMN